MTGGFRTRTRTLPVWATVCTGVVLLLGLLGHATSAQTGQVMDEDFAERVREWTTSPEFLSPLVDHLPVGDGIPSPKDVLGHHAGAERELTYYADLMGYYAALADASPRVTLMPIGETDEGREMVVVAIASEETETTVRYANGPLLDVPRRYRDDWVLMTFPGSVRSGHLNGVSQTEDRPAIVDVPKGDGRIILFATNPCYRWQNHGEFNMLFNTILHHDDLDDVPMPVETDEPDVGAGL
jgi:hypothetical protein